MSDDDEIWFPITDESIKSVPQFTEFGANETNKAVHNACIEILSDLKDDELETEEAVTIRLSDLKTYKKKRRTGRRRSYSS